MAAQLDLDGRREPAQPEPIALGHQKRRLRQVHLGGDVLHPGRVGRRVEQADGGRVAAEGPIGEGVDLQELRHGHNLHLE